MINQPWETLMMLGEGHPAVGDNCARCQRPFAAGALVVLKLAPAEQYQSESILVCARHELMLMTQYDAGRILAALKDLRDHVGHFRATVKTLAEAGVPLGHEIKCIGTYQALCKIADTV